MSHARATGASARLRTLHARTARAIVFLVAVLSCGGAGTAVAMAAAGHASPTSGGSGLTPPLPITIGTSPTPASGTTPSRPSTHGTSHPQSDPLAQRGMWIWELSSTDGGNVPDIVAQARTLGIRTLLIKSGDGTSYWSQFSSALVRSLHAAGLKVCAWQYVYGVHPQAEAQVGAQAVSDGANCLVIDAETEYQGRYVQAQTYLRTLRKLIGANFPVGLASFPYVDYHPGFPYSVFLGPDGAQYNVPQMYWKDIGVTVDAVYAHTYEFNTLYRRPILPLGQIYDSPSREQVMRFRSMSRSYGAANVSWWDWQSAAPSDLSYVSAPAGQLKGFSPDRTVATLGQHAQGDLVVWAQEHLVSAGEAVSIDGDFGAQTEQAVVDFQAAHALTQNGFIDPETWTALLRYAPAAVTWTARGGAGQVVATTRSREQVLPTPNSASRPERADELAGAGGAGRPRR